MITLRAGSDTGTADAMVVDRANLDRAVRDATRELLAERVARGVALLDREMPGWWRVDQRDGTGWRVEPIDLDRFDMVSPGWCVFGQLEGPGMTCAYFEMAKRMFPDRKAEELERVEIEHGVWGQFDRHYPILTELWREVIEKRRANA